MPMHAEYGIPSSINNNSWSNFLAWSIVEYSLVFGCKCYEKKIIWIMYFVMHMYDKWDIWVTF
jgi:hypothetical protein